MAVAAPFAALAALFVLVAFYMFAKQVLTPMIVSTLRHVPAVGRILSNAADNAVNAAVGAIVSWLSPQLRTLIRWIKAAESATLAIPNSIVRMASQVEKALVYLARTKIPQMINASIHVVSKMASDALSLAHTAINNVVAAEHRLQHGIEAGIRDLRTELLGRFARGIDRLRNDVFDRAIPGVERDIAKAARAAEADIGRVAHDVGNVARDLQSLAKRLNVPVSVLEALIAAVGIEGALQALNSLARCEPKLRSLCQYDPKLWDEFLIGILSLLAFPGLREMALMGASLMEDVGDAVKELAES